MANGLCMACGFGNHLIGDCLFKRTWNFAATPLALSARAVPPALSTPPMRMNPGPTGIALLPPQSQAFSQAQKGVKPGIRCRRGQAYNLTLEEAEASEEVWAGKILVHSNPVLALFDSSASHCFISSKFVILHYPLCV